MMKRRSSLELFLAETEDTWEAVFTSAGQRYQPPKLVLYEDQVSSACRFNSVASGPFLLPRRFSNLY